MKTTKMFSIIAIALMLLSVLNASLAFAASTPSYTDITVEYIKIDGERFDPYDQTDTRLEVERGQELPIRVRVTANSDVEDVQVTAQIAGYEYSEYESDKVLQMTETFDLDEDHTKNVDMDLEIPSMMDTDDLKLRFYIADRNSNAFVKEYNLAVEGFDDEDAVVIKRVSLNPSNSVMTGRAVSALVKVENLGRDDLDDVTLIARVPGLNIQDTETLDELEVDEAETFEEILLRIPRNAQPGQYRVDFIVEFDEYESTTTSDMITVVENTVDCYDCDDADSQDDASQKTHVTVPTSKELIAGGNGVVYPVTIVNNADSAITYSLSTAGVSDWGVVRVDPSATLTAPAKSSVTGYMYVSANEDAAGSKQFSVTITANGDQKTIPLSASVVESDDSSSWNGVTRALEIGLIVLVIVLILIGLVVGFNKLRGNDDDNDNDEAKTYY